MFATIGRSWEYAKISYGIIWDYRRLLIFPLISMTACTLVMLSFLAPLWGTGTLEQWLEFVDSESSTTPAAADQVWMYVTLFLFYFCNYFVILFFNSGLTACAMKVINGQTPTIGYGMSVASRRLPQILAWALVSAVVGVLLKAIENAHEKAGQIVAAILGCAWSALTYFVVPVMVIDGVGPVNAFTRSARTLKSTWGEALVGHFSLGLLSFLIMLPVILIVAVLGFLALGSGNTVGLVAAGVVAALLIVIAASATTAADVVFKAILYNYATGQSLPAGVDGSDFRSAFAPKR